MAVDHDSRGGASAAPTRHCVEDRIEPARLEPVLAAWKASGVRAVNAPDGTVWLAAEKWALSRFPGLPGGPIGEAAARSLFREPRVWLLDYLLPADETHPANALLYLFEGERYSLEDLSKNGRRDARKAARELEIGWITHDQLLAHGLEVFADCRSRAGLSDGTPEHFQRRFAPLRHVPGYHYAGAWKGDELAAFMTVHAVEGWAWIAAYSHSAHRGSCPNDGLIHFALEHCVNERGVRSISYGLSSVQEESKAASLHDFKLKAGFKAVPVHRAFLAHPLLSPVAARGALALVHLALRITPGNRMLRKASGVLARLVPGRGDASSATPDAS